MSNEMQQMMEMMTAMKAQMEKQSEELHTLRAETDASKPVDESELAKRVKVHNQKLRVMIDAQKAAIAKCFGYTEEDDDRIPPEMRANGEAITFYREVVQQLMWSISTSSARQYLYSRYRADVEYLRLHKVMDRLSAQTRQQTDGITPVMMEINPQRDYDRAESTYNYYVSQMLPYEVVTYAAAELWYEIVEEKRAEALDAGTQFREPNPPTCEIDEATYVAYVENMATKREAASIADGADLLRNARLLKMVQLSHSEAESES